MSKKKLSKTAKKSYSPLEKRKIVEEEVRSVNAAAKLVLQTDLLKNHPNYGFC
jgi:hypothetical protein